MIHSRQTYILSVLLRAAFLCCLTFLSSCMDEELNARKIEEGRPVQIELAFGMVESQLKTRSALEDEEEKKLFNLYLWVFDRLGNLEFSKEYDQTALYQAAEDLSEEIDPNAPTSQGLLKGINITSGKKTFVMLANFREEKGGLFLVDLESLKAVDNIKKLAAVKAEMVHRSLFRPNGNLLMAAQKEIFLDPETKRVEMNVRRTDAKVTLNITTGNGLTFSPEKWMIGNIPVSTFLLEIPKGSSQGAEWDAGGMEGKNYWTSDKFEFEGDEQHDITATFYMPENRKMAKQKIVLENSTDDALRKGYNLRQKQEKVIDPEAGKKPNLINGSTIYAPDYAPYVEFTGRLEHTMNMESGGQQRYADVKYRIYLGYTSKTDPVNDYDIERNVHYTYNIKISGVQDIVVEALSDKDNETENSPGAEGTVFDSQRTFLLDCHYEQRLVRFNKSDLNVFEPDGSLKAGAEVSFRISTPFDTRIITYTAEELKELKNNLFKPVPAKKTDTDWVQFYIHPNTLTANADETMMYYSDTGVQLISLEEFLYRLMMEPENMFNERTGLCKLTIFVNEYFYERNPMQNNSGKDPALWKLFANAKDRTFDLLVNTQQHISPDGQSGYHQAIVSLRQMSIKTVFARENGELRVWGVENINETPDLDWFYLEPANAGAYYNKYYANGWSNTWKMMAVDASAIGEGGWRNKTMKDPMNKGKEKQLWQNMTITTGGKLSLNPNHYVGLIYKTSNANYACFTPFLRNRDNNRDGIMQASEMQWYIPSVAETNLLWVAERALPKDARIYGHADDNVEGTVFYTSRAYMGPSNLVLNSPNPISFVIETHSMSMLLDLLDTYGWGPGKAGDRVAHSEFRLIRDLGKLEDDPDNSYHIMEMAQELKKTLSNEWTKEGYLKFGGDVLLSNTKRSTREIYELPAHNENSQINTIYRNGFEVAKYIANKVDKEKDLKKPNIRAEYYYANWIQLTSDIENGKSPCLYYYQNPDKSDKGTWRVPNEAELQIMAGSLFDWHPAERNKVYPFTTDFDLNLPLYARFHARTGFSQKNTSGIRGFGAGYQMYFNGYIRFVSTVDLNWAGDSNHELNLEGYVRCVRDNP